MSRRLDLHAELINVLNNNNVYFQPPESITMRYPAIRYELNSIDVDHANDKQYRKHRVYTITLIDPNPDNTFVDEILKIPMCRFDNSYRADNLNHYVFTLNF